MAVTTASKVSNFFITRFQEAGDPLTNMKLQKLLYYAQGWFLALKNESLFDDRFEAWPHGPVVPPVYGSFKKFQWNPIIDEAIKTPTLPQEVEKHLEEIMAVYGTHGAYYLEKLTHQEAPWLEARQGLGPTEPCNCVISAVVMKEYFSHQN